MTTRPTAHSMVADRPYCSDIEVVTSAKTSEYLPKRLAVVSVTQSVEHQALARSMASRVIVESSFSSILPNELPVLDC